MVNFVKMLDGFIKFFKLKSILYGLYIVIIALMPYCFHSNTGVLSDIVPAVDIAVVYYVFSYGLLNKLQLFLIGAVIDSIVGLPIGISSFSILSASMLFSFSNNVIILKSYVANILIFALYCSYVISVRCFLIEMVTYQEVDIIAAVFLIFSTISSYPIIYYLMKLPERIFCKEIV